MNAEYLQSENIHSEALETGSGRNGVEQVLGLTGGGRGLTVASPPNL